MPSASHIAQRILKQSLLLEDYLARGMINYAALAEEIAPKIEAELGKKVKYSAVAMGLRRHAERMQRQELKLPSLNDCEIMLKSKIGVITAIKSPTLFNALNKINELINFEKGDILNIVHGNTDVSIIINEKYKKKILSFLKQQKILNEEYGLVGLTVRFGIDFLHTPGITYTFLRALAMENVNLIEIVSSTVETTFFISEKDAVRAYNALSELTR